LPADIIGCCINIWKEFAMSWKAPKIVEVALGGEINSYVCARLK